MICPDCGTKNPSGSKFCNNCGASLSSDSGHICPNCQTPNPNHILYCDNCGTRLAEEHLPDEDEAKDDASSDPPNRSEPFSLPSRPPGETPNLEVRGEIPDWLKTGEEATPGAEPSDSSDREKDLPEWAREAQASGEAWEDEEAPTLDDVSADHSPVDDLPIWLMDEETADSIFTKEKSTDELFEASKSPPAEDAEDTDAEETLPEWLQGLATSTSSLPSLEEENSESEIPRTAGKGSGGEDELEPDEGAPAETGQADKTVSSLRSWLADMEAGEANAKPAADDDMAEWLASMKAGEPTADPTGEGDEAIPDWLADTEIGHVAEDASAPSAKDRGEEVPDWLAEISASGEAGTEEPTSRAPEEAGGDIPNWLAEMSGSAELTDAGEPADETPGETGEEDADWLSALDIEEPLPDEIGLEDTEVEETTLDWLADLEAEAATTPESEDAFDKEMEPAADEEDKEAAPDWLAGLAAGSVEPEESAEAEVEEEDVPDWLVNLAAETGQVVESEDPAGTESEDIPAWLAGLDKDAGEAIPAPAEGKDEEEDFPTWLVDSTPTEADATPADDAEALSGDQVTLDWLTEMEVDEADLAAEEGAEEGDDWLSEMAEEDAGGAEDLIADRSPASDLPDWLHEMAPPDTGPLVPPDEDATVEDLDEFLSDLDDEEELPVWLVGAEAPPEVTDETGGDEAEEFPDWLSDSDFAEELSAARPDADAELRGPLEGEGAEAEPGKTEAARESEADAEAYVPADDLPEWLNDVMLDMDDTEASMFDEENAPTPAALDSLQQDLAAWPEAREEEKFERDTVSSEAEAEPTPLDELPEWLRPPGGIEGISLEEDDKWGHLLDELPPPQEPGQELSEADIPEWLQALKPRELAQQAEEGAEDEEEEPAVEAGPLAGLRGVVEIEPVIAEAHVAERIGQYTISREQQQQATLLRQLVSTVPGETVLVGAQPERAPSALVRIILAVLLLATVLAGLYFPDLVETPPAATLAETERIIADAAPRPVLVAFEYTPAMAGALDAQASWLVEQLADNDSQILYTSQSAAGLALAEQKVEGVTRLSSERVGYLPGGPVGLRRLASCLQSDTQCQTIFGQPLSDEVSTALADSALLVVLAGDRESAINWIEQVAAPTETPIVAVVPQAVAPVVAPYYASGQLSALVGESPAAVADAEPADTDFPGGSDAQATALALSQWLVISLLLAGNLIYLIRGSFRSGRRNGT